METVTIVKLIISGIVIAFVGSYQYAEAKSDYYDEGEKLPWILFKRIGIFFLISILFLTIIFGGSGDEIDEPPRRWEYGRA